MITFLSQPNTIEPAYGNLVFQFESTGATDPTLYKFRYVVNVFTQDGFITQLKITPSSQGWGQIDLSPILRNYVSGKPSNIGCGGNDPIHEISWGYLNDNMIIYSLVVGEEYATSPAGSVVLYDGNGNVGEPNNSSDICYSYTGVKEWFNGKQYNFQPYFLTGSTGDFPQYTSRFMTNSPRTRYIREGDYATLAAFNWYSASPTILFSPVDSSRQIYSAIFKFYDVDNNLLQSSRSYNIYDLCGTRPNCSYYDGYWDRPDNFAEQQVVYIGVGTPNLAEHGIAFPNDTKYYSVELEGTQSQPTPPTPEIADFDGCSCHTYSYSNPFVEEAVIFTYLDCVGSGQTITIEPLSTGTWCACQNSNSPNISTEVAVDDGVCEVCECKTYDVENEGAEPSLFSYTNCSGDTINDDVDPGETKRICACEGSIEAGGLNVYLIGDCPLPFSADCRTYAVSYSASTPYNYTYTGCCGTEITTTIPPSTSYFLKINYPAPTPAGITATLIGSATPDPCVDPVPEPETTFSGGTRIIGRNLCDNTLQYFTYSGDPITAGVFFNWDNTCYEFIGIGGGGFIFLDYPFVFATEAQALSAFPCPNFTTGSCLNTIVISEPFYFYLDEKCSSGNRVVFWLNKMGTWDSFNFRSREDIGYGVDKQVYQSSPELYSEGWDNPSYYGWNSRRNVWKQNVAKSGILFTDLLPQAESIWLSQELFQSPSVYQVGDDGVLEPIVLTNTEVSQPNYQINATQYQISIEYKSAYDTIRQNQE